VSALTSFYRDLTLKPQGFTIVVAGFLPIFAIVAMFPLVAAMIAHFHADPGAAIKVPAMVTAPGYAIAILAPFAGMAVDRFGRRPLLLTCTFLYGIVGAMPFLLNDLDMIIVSRVLLGVCEAGILTIVNTLIADYWNDGGRRNWLMLQGIIGPAIQPPVFIIVSAIAAMQWNAGFLVYLVAFPVFVAMYFYLYEPSRSASAATHRDQPAVGRFPLAAAAIVGVVTLLASGIYYAWIVNGSIIWKEIGLTNPMAVSQATFVPAFFILLGAFIFRYISRFSDAVQISAFLAALGLGLAGIGLARTVFEVQVALAVQQTGAGMAVPALIAWAQTKFGFEHRGRGMGVWTCAFFLGQAVSPIVIGFLAETAGSMQAAFRIIGIAAVAGGVIAIVALPRLAASRSAAAA